MTHQPHYLSNLSLAQKYFNSLPSDDISRKYAAGERYVSGWINSIKLFFSVENNLKELNQFYPYQPVVKKTLELYQEKWKENRDRALIFSGVSIFSVYNMARQNVVLPIFKKFCSLKTHRLFRQYLVLAFLPYLFAEGYTNYFFLNQTDKLWAVHASRLNQGLLRDPEDSQYPLELLPASQVHTYVTPRVHPYDRKKKLANEVDIMVAPDYQNIEEWEKAPLKEPSDDDEEDEDEEGGDGEEGGDAEEEDE